MENQKFYYGMEPSEKKHFTRKEIAEAGYELDELAKKYIRDHNLENSDYDKAFDRVCEANPELHETWASARV